MSPFGGDRFSDEPSLKELFSEMTSELSLLVRKEVELAKVEMKEQATRAGKTVGLLGAAGVAALLGVVLLSFAAAWGLAVVLPTGVGFLIVALLYLGAAAVLAAKGRKEAAGIEPVPERTLETLKDDVKVAKAALTRGMKKPLPTDGSGTRG